MTSVFHSIHPASDAFSVGRPGRRGAFTLVELMVVIVILGILASLSLAGLAVTRQRARIAKTRSTIRKISEIITPHYESYLSRRVTASTNSGGDRRALALERLQALRFLLVTEMPDQWSDVNGNAAITAPARRYATYKAALGNTLSPAYESAECLAMIVSRGGFAPDAMENFRTDEFGDIDGDGAPEFHDGWGRPIAFIRWPSGYPGFSQTTPDPFDPMGVSGAGQGRDWAVTPLIYSPGPDESVNDPLSGTQSGYGLWGAFQGGWLSLPNLATTRPTNATNLPGSVKDPVAARDNITNLDLSTN